MSAVSVVHFKSNTGVELHQGKWVFTVHRVSKKTWVFLMSAVPVPLLNLKQLLTQFSD